MSEAAALREEWPQRRDTRGIGEQCALSDSVHVSAFSVHPKWITRFRINGGSVGGSADLIGDSRFQAWLDSGVTVEGRRVLELGPLEGAHTAMLCHAGARHVVGVEGRAENFAKCCIVKNVLSLDRATFVFDDIVNVTHAVYGRFDVALACGVLYHLGNPMRVIAQLAELAPVAMIWTHIATDGYPRGKAVTLTVGGESFRGKWYREPKTLLAGLEAKSFWPFLPDLRRMFDHSGFDQIDEIDVDWDHFQGAAWLGTVRRGVDGTRSDR